MERLRQLLPCVDPLGPGSQRWPLIHLHPHPPTSCLGNIRRFLQKGPEHRYGKGAFHLQKAPLAALQAAVHPQKSASRDNVFRRAQQYAQANRHKSDRNFSVFLVRWAACALPGRRSASKMPPRPASVRTEPEAPLPRPLPAQSERTGRGPPLPVKYWRD